VSEQTGEQTGDDTRQTGLTGGGVSPDRLPRDDEPGGDSTPRDTEGAGPVGLEDRTDGDGAPAANQAKAEPIAPTPGHRDPNAPLVPPVLEDMNVGTADPQSPSHPAAVVPSPPAAGAPAARLDNAGSAPAAQRPASEPGTSTGRATGPEQPISGTPGLSHRAPGMQGATGPDESVESDLARGVREVAPDGPSTVPSDGSAGDAAGVPVPSRHASEGTSEEHGTARGVRTPEAGS
jgi:hypothetical protein